MGLLVYGGWCLESKVGFLGTGIPMGSCLIMLVLLLLKKFCAAKTFHQSLATN